MRVEFIAVLIASFVLVACGSGKQETATVVSSSAIASLPTTVDGDLAIDVAEGDVEEGGASEFNFGTLTLGSDEIPIQVSGTVLQSAGLSESGGKVRATLSAKTEQFGQTVYTISSLQRL